MRRKCSILLIALLTAISLCACGTPLYEMTEDEEDLIATYCASTVAKFNRFQKDGLVFVVNKTTAEQQAALGKQVAALDEDEIAADDTQDEYSDITEETAETESPEEADTVAEVDASIGELLGYPDLEIYCDTMFIVEQYQEGNYILLTPNEGNKYLVLEVSIENPSEKPMDCDFLEKSPCFIIELKDGTRIQTEGTILLDDFSTFKESVNAHGKAYAVALAQGPAGKLTDTDGLRVYLQAGGTSTELPIVEP